MIKCDFLPLEGLNDANLRSEENSYITVQSVSLFSEVQPTCNSGSRDCCCLLGFFPLLFLWPLFDLYRVFFIQEFKPKEKKTYEATDIFAIKESYVVSGVENLFKQP